MSIGRRGLAGLAVFAALAGAGLLVRGGSGALLLWGGTAWLMVIVVEGSAELWGRRKAGHRGDASTAERRLRRIAELFAFVGSSTPTLIGVARTGGADVLDGWLDLLSNQLAAAYELSSVGAMVLRERLELRHGDFVPVCRVEFVGGSHRCTLPKGREIEIVGEIADDIAVTVGARSVFLAAIDGQIRRRWACLVFASPLSDPLAQSLCDALVAPISHVLLTASRESALGAGVATLRGEQP